MIKVLHKALNLLETVARCPDGLTNSEIAAQIGEKPTTTSNIVQLLCRRGYLEKRDGRYRIGVAAYTLTGHARDYDGALCRRAGGAMERLAQETGSSVVLAVWRGDERYVLLRAADPSEITVSERVADDGQVYTTATGMVLLAHQPQETADAYMEAHGLPGTEDGADGFRRELRRIAASRCFSRVKGQIFEAAVPVPLPTDRGGVTTAVGLYLPLFRAGDPDALSGALADCAARIADDAP